LILISCFIFMFFMVQFLTREKIVFCCGGFGYNSPAALLPPERMRRARMWFPKTAGLLCFLGGLKIRKSVVAYGPPVTGWGRETF